MNRRHDNLNYYTFYFNILMQLLYQKMVYWLINVLSNITKPAMKTIASLMLYLMLMTTVKAQHEALFNHQDSTAKSGFVLYPNPTKDVAYLEHTCPVTEVSIFNLFGLVIDRFETNRNQHYVLDLSEIDSGMFFIQITDEKNRIFVQKLIRE
jgi:hypothetical protein